MKDDLESGGYRHWLGIIEKHLEGRTCLDVLDVGTGPGFFPVILGRNGHRVTGVDASDAMLAKAADNCAKYGVEAEFRNMNALDLDFPDESFDLVVSRNLVWNLEDPAKAYSEWLRVLRPGGKLMVFDGNHYLFLYDRDYEALDSYRGMGREKDHAHMGNVDPKIIENIARDLPLSCHRRPQWDSDTLMEMGVRTLHIQTDGRDSFHMEKDGKDVYLPFSFFICACK